MAKILVPIDGSEIGNQALPWAKLLAEKGGFDLQLLRSYHPLASVYSYPDFATPPPVAYDLSGFARHAKKHLEILSKEYNLDDPEMTVQEGESAETILSRSESDDVELVVMSSHGRTGLGRWLLGSTATKVLRGGCKPVLVVKAQEEQPEAKLERVLVPLDGSDLSEEAVPHALKLQKVLGCKVRLFRSVDFTPYPVADVQKALEREMSEAERYLESVKAKYPEVEFESEVRAVGVSKGILDAAEDCDVILMSAHGMSGFERWLLGSVTEKVLNRSNKPVYIVCHKK